MTPQDAARLAACDALGAPYRWAGNGPDTFDCSGFVLWVIRKARSWTRQDLPDKTSQQLWNEFTPTTDPDVGDLAFYGAAGDRVGHVMMVLRRPDSRLWSIPVVGASGGGMPKDGEPIEDYWRRMDDLGAMVKVYRSHEYRKDFLGFRRSPL